MKTLKQKDAQRQTCIAYLTSLLGAHDFKIIRAVDSNILVANIELDEYSDETEMTHVSELLAKLDAQLTHGEDEDEPDGDGEDELRERLAMAGVMSDCESPDHYSYRTQHGVLHVFALDCDSDDENYMAVTLVLVNNT